MNDEWIMNMSNISLAVSVDEMFISWNPTLSPTVGWPVGVQVPYDGPVDLSLCVTAKAGVEEILKSHGLLGSMGFCWVILDMNLLVSTFWEAAWLTANQKVGSSRFNSWMVGELFGTCVMGSFLDALRKEFRPCCKRTVLKKHQDLMKSPWLNPFLRLLAPFEKPGWVIYCHGTSCGGVSCQACCRAGYNRHDGVDRNQKSR